VTETHTILGRNFGGTGGRPESKPVPPTLHWDEWLGPAPFREYHEKLHPFDWRSWRAFGTGTIGDMACHNLDVLYWALKIGEAKTFTVECLGTNGGSEEMFPQNNIVRYEVPARGNLPAVKIHVYDEGKLMPEIMKNAQQEHGAKFGESTLFVGEKGLFHTTGTAGAWEFPAQVAQGRVSRAAQDPGAGARRSDRGLVLRDQERRQTVLELRRRVRHVHRVRPHRPPRAIRRRRKEARVGRGKNEVHECAGDQSIHPPRVPQRVGGITKDESPCSMAFRRRLNAHDW
jgi:predicted dehydrogenase